MMWEQCGMSRSASSLEKLLDQLPSLREEFWRDVTVPGTGAQLNQSLEKAGRVADFLELAELLAIDALHREESCGGHFREEFQTPDGEARRDDDHFAYVAGWEWAGEKGSLEPVTSGPLPTPVLHKEPLEFRTRSFQSTDLQVRRLGRPSNHQPDPARLAPGGPARRPGRWCATTPRASAPTCPSWRCSTWSTSG